MVICAQRDMVAELQLQVQFLLQHNIFYLDGGQLSWISEVLPLYAHSNV